MCVARPSAATDDPLRPMGKSFDGYQLSQFTIALRICGVIGPIRGEIGEEGREEGRGGKSSGRSSISVITRIDLEESSDPVRKVQRSYIPSVESLGVL